MTHRKPVSVPEVDQATARTVSDTLVDWFAHAQRPLPWRAADTSAWAVLVSEVMSHQTPMSRVEPVWRAWMERWPTPQALAAAPTAEVLVAWGSLGYPRRALRLQECAQAIGDGDVPRTEEELLELPGIGPYTAAAVASFAFGERTVVLDVNVRRVLSRVFAGVDHPKPALSKKEHAWARQFVPQERHVEFNAAAMELGALVCTSRNPRCEECPVAEHCAWLATGKPQSDARPKTQAWHGTDRQLRGAIMKTLKESRVHNSEVRVDYFVAPANTFDDTVLTELPEPVATALSRVRELGTHDRIARLIDDLVTDGLATSSSGVLRLP